MNTLPPIPWSTTGTFMLGLLGVLTVVGLLLWIWNQGQRAFARTPPLDEELDVRDKNLRKMIFAAERNLNGRMDRIEQRYEEMQLDRQRKWEEIKTQLSDQAQTLSYIRGKLDEQENRRTT